MNTAEKTQHDLIHEGQPLVHSLAAQICRNIPMRVELDELIAYGQVGLAEAARSFDPEQGIQFTTFAYYRVRGAIYDGLSKMSWTSRARLRRLRYQQMANETLKQDAETTGDLDRTSLEGRAKWFGSVTEKLAIVYLNTHGDEGTGIRDSAIEDPTAIRPPAILARRELTQKLHEHVEGLPAVERRLIQMTYFDGMTLQEAGERLGISKSWASRLHAKTLEKLARSLRREGDSDSGIWG